MKPILSGAALALCFLGAAPAWAQAPAPQPRTLTMAGHGAVEAVPDTAILSVGVTGTGSTASAALTANTGKMTALLTALKAQGIAGRAIQTENFSVSPQYAHDDDRRIVGYQVGNRVSVRLDDVAQVGTVLDAAVRAGANQVNGVRFSIRNAGALLDEARDKAVADARAKAEAYAKAAGVVLGPILSISENGAAPRPVPLAAPAMFARTVPVEAGEQTVTADVVIVWEIR